MLVVHRGEGLHALTPMFAHGSAECEPQNLVFAICFESLAAITKGHVSRRD
jgi:hypothetical protein